MLPNGGCLLSAFGDDEGAIGSELHAGGELPRLGGLPKCVAEHFVKVGLAVAIGVA